MKKAFSFIVALWVSFVFTPSYALEPTREEIEKFQSEFYEELRKAEDTMDNTQGYRSRISSIKGRVAVVGDLHGDLQTLRKIIDCLSLALDSGAINKVVFLGDIMDRGSDSAQTLLELLKFFNRYKGKIYIVRGNHETIAMFDRESTDGYIAARSDPYFSGIDNEVFRAFFDKLLVGVIINKHTHSCRPWRNSVLFFMG